MKSTLICATISLFAWSCQSRSADESPTGALIRFPGVSNKSSPLYNISWDVAPSQFGFHDYGGTLDGIMVLPKNTSYHRECTAEKEDSNLYVHWVEDLDASSQDAAWVLMIDRGDCYFVQKVEHAQNMGASGVIVLDNKYEGLFTMWPPDNWDDDITIPSVLLQRTHGDTLMAELNVKNWNPNSPSAMTYPQPASALNLITVQIEWGLPHPDDRVEYELYTSANDYDSVKFKKNFRGTALGLDYHNYTIFSPHVYILNGSHWHCDSGFPQCGNQCTNSGRYCAVDPEYDTRIGLDGMDVVQENLRQACLWKYIKANEYPHGTGDANESLWWDYSILWDKYCFESNNTLKTFNANCSFAQMDKLDDRIAPYVDDCIENSGGYGYRDGFNSILDAETRLREDRYVFAMPTVQVNEYMVHGNIDCEEVTEQTCQVLDAICAGFLEGTEPPICDVKGCTDDQKDCFGVCGGTAIVDECGKCLEMNDPEFNSCVDCTGVVNGSAKLDCRGVCQGGYVWTDCGYCEINTTEGRNIGKDCMGNCGYTYQVDLCGNCLEVSNPDWNSCIDCDGNVDGDEVADCQGTCGGDYVLTDCGICVNGSASDFNNDEGKDCRGVCEGDWDLDECDVCLSPSDPNRNDCEDCRGNVGNDYVWNECGLCVENTEDGRETGKDCRGVCNGGYAYDECGVCRSLSDQDWNDCQSGSSSSSGGNSSSKNATTAVVIISIIAFLVILIACIVIYRLWKRQQLVDKRFSSIMKTYQLMDEAPGSGGNASKGTRGGAMAVPDADPDEDETIYGVDDDTGDADL